MARIKMKTGFKIIILCLVLVLAILITIYCYFFIGSNKSKENITWGVDFSQMQAEWFGLNWKEFYLAIMDDLKVKNIKIHAQWDFVEGDKKDEYYFDDIDWQIKQAEKRNVKIIYVLGMKTGRWPECHVPGWAKGLSKERQQTELLKYMTEVVLRYKSSKSIINWQIENEPLFRFGECPSWYYKNDDFLKTEIGLVKSLDPTRQIIISDSGEQSSWTGVAKIGDIVGVTMYRKVWAGVSDTFGLNVYSFLNPTTYRKKAELIKKVYGKDTICIELQAEPWASTPLLTAPLPEQEKSMNVDLFKENIEFAKQTGMDKFYLWGVEWWYWMKEKQNKPEIWNVAKDLFNQN